MPNHIQSAIGKALEAILYGPPGGTYPDVLLIDYGNKQTFSDLWLHGFESPTPTIAGQEFDLNDGSKQILIIGNDPPDGVFNEGSPSLQGINFRDHFTATSWLAAWKVKFTPSQEEKKNGKKGALARIAVIDPREASFSRGATPALQTVLAARNSDSQTLVPRVTILNAPSLDGICHWLLNSKADTRETAAHFPDLLKSTIWNELTSAREQHHALSNILGAFLLRAQFEKGSEDPSEPRVQDCLAALTRACGLAAKPPQLPATERPGSQAWAGGVLQSRIRAVLVDDMADLWEDFLRAALGLNDEQPRKGYVSAWQSFVATGSAEFRRTMLGLPARLTKFLTENRRCITVSDLIPGKHQFERDFLLFLDLRLFPENDGQNADRFHEQLVVLTRQLLAQKIRPLPWLDGRRYVELERELDGDAIAGHPRETLLPRILSLLDPTLPILIFSSTHRTELIDPFRDYGNIITTFRKPILTGMSRDWDEIVNELRADFTSAVEQATNILGVRRKLARLTLAKPVAPPREATSQQGRIIEIYVDESGDPFNQRDPGFAVGGIMLQHENEEAQRAFHTAINQSLRKWGVSDYAPDRIKADEVADKLPQIAFYPKRPNPGSPEESEGLTCVSSALNNGTRIAAFAIIEPDLLRFHQDTRLDSGILFDHNSLDNIYHFLLRTNLEVLLFEHPWVDLARDALHINIATRDQRVPHNLTRRVWQQAYGLEFKERRGDWFYTSLRGDSIFRLVGEILRTRDVFKDRPDVLTARGVTLNDYEEIVRNWRENGQNPRLNSQLYDPTRLDPKQIHYVADWIIRMALYRPEGLPALVSEWFRAGYIQPVNAHFVTLMEACRLSKAGKSISLVSKISLSTEDSVRTGIRAERYLRQTASNWPEQLTGDELRALFREPSAQRTISHRHQPAVSLPAPSQISPAVAREDTRSAVAPDDSVESVANGATPNKAIEIAPIRRRVLIEAPTGCDIRSVLAALDQTEDAPRPVAIRAFESEQKVEFILDMTSVEEVRKLVGVAINIGGTKARAIDVTLPASQRVIVFGPSVFEQTQED